jgi:transposase
MELPTCILVDPTAVMCEALKVADDGLEIQLEMATIQTSAACPVCGQASRRVHSHYRRHLADLPWAQVTVTIDLRVRRLFCDNRDCARKIFTERLPSIVTPWARRTVRLAKRQEKVGLVAGGSAGATLCTDLGLPITINALLDLLDRLHLSPAQTPRVLGVDDWAKCKGQRYGTILVDHERERVIDLLDDRTSETLAAWLQAHHEVEIVTRDRAGAYAEGIRLGAPQAIQVADRWHLLKNLTESLMKVFQDHHRAIQAQFRPEPPNKPLAGTTPTCELAPKSGQLPAADTVAAGTPADRRRQQRAEEMHVLHQQGMAMKDIARRLHCHRKTVSRTLQRALPLPPRQGRRRRLLAPFEAFLVDRWNAGCHNAARLYREIGPRGYTGRMTQVRLFVSQLRHESGLAPRSRQPGGRPIKPRQVERPPSLRLLAWLATRPLTELTAERQAIMTRLGHVNSTVKTAVELAQTFSRLVCQRLPEQLDPWFDQAMNSGLAPLRGFVRSLREDEAAVRAALTLSWSNGRTEGSVNRLKLLKRQMYGRAGLKLLRQRVLAAP